MNKGLVMKTGQTHEDGCVQAVFYPHATKAPEARLQQRQGGAKHCLTIFVEVNGTRGTSAADLHFTYTPVAASSKGMPALIRERLED